LIEPGAHHDGDELERARWESNLSSFESSFLDSLVDELPDAGGLEDELGVLESVQELIEFVLGGREPLV
jgi:hypothetical protein